MRLQSDQNVDEDSIKDKVDQLFVQVEFLAPSVEERLTSQEQMYIVRGVYDDYMNEYDDYMNEYHQILQARN